jgi:hypothetical protein
MILSIFWIGTFKMTRSNAKLQEARQVERKNPVSTAGTLAAALPCSRPLCYGSSRVDMETARVWMGKNQC